ncbi:MAG TPA: helix-turn-helix domain-containing protein, partial [Kineosporiaceae bacterium]|nr:helix-turn-helix domain-containing protein [Kineosporiaceae bacterium]
RGIPAQASLLPVQEWSGGGRRLGDLESVWGRAFVDAGGGRGQVERVFAEAGPGARGVVAVFWPVGGGHVFSVENVAGRVLFVDAQNNSMDAGGYLDTAADVQYLRLDDLAMPREVADFVEVPSEYAELIEAVPSRTSPAGTSSAPGQPAPDRSAPDHTAPEQVVPGRVGVRRAEVMVGGLPSPPHTRAAVPESLDVPATSGNLHRAQEQRGVSHDHGVQHGGAVGEQHGGAVGEDEDSGRPSSGWYSTASDESVPGSERPPLRPPGPTGPQRLAPRRFRRLSELGAVGARDPGRAADLPDQAGTAVAGVTVPAGRARASAEFAGMMHSGDPDRAGISAGTAAGDTVRNRGIIGDDDSDGASSATGQPPTRRRRIRPPTTYGTVPAETTSHATGGKDAQHIVPAAAPGRWSSGAGAQYARRAEATGGAGLRGRAGPDHRSTRARRVRIWDEVPSVPAEVTAATLAQSLYEEGMNGPQVDPVWGPVSPGGWSDRDVTPGSGNAVADGGVDSTAEGSATVGRRAGKAPMTSDRDSPQGYLSQDPASSDSPSPVRRFPGTGTWVGRLQATAGASTSTGRRATGPQPATRTASARRRSTAARVPGAVPAAVVPQPQPQPGNAAVPATRTWWAPGAMPLYLTDPGQMRTLMREQNLTHARLARAVGTHPPTITQLLSGAKPHVSKQNARRISRTLGVPLETLFSHQAPPGVAAQDRRTTRTGIGAKTAVLKDRHLLRALIEASPLNRLQLAQRAGLRSRGMLHHLLTGTRTSVRRRTAVGLAEALGTHVSNLFTAAEPWVDRPEGLRRAPSSDEGPTFEPNTDVRLIDRDLLRTLMQDRVSTIELGAAIGISSTRIDRLRTGVLSRLPSAVGEALAHYLDVHPEVLFRGTRASAAARQAAVARRTASRPQPVSRPQVTVISRDFLNDVRRAARVSRADLARSTGWEHAGAVSQLLDGHRTTLDAVAAERISQHLGTPVGTFFTIPGSSSAAPRSGPGGRTNAGATGAPGATVSAVGVRRPTWWSPPSGTPVVVVPLSAADHPSVVQHVRDAIGAGHPAVLTLDRDETRRRRRRRHARARIAARDGYDRDEYPPASTWEGGAGASVRHVPLRENRGAGSVMRIYLRPYPDGTRFRMDTGDDA